MPSKLRVGLAAKRGLDLLGAFVGIVVLSPVLAATAFAILVGYGRPIFFRQRRPGRGGLTFTIYKFRTMRPPIVGEETYLADGRRLTALGRILRETSLDELPELWNVLRGDMSLVGPRPLLVEYLDSYDAEESRRHDMLPGITGWAAVNGRHSTKFRDRLRLDTWYVEHWSLWLDLKILVMTLYQVIRRKDVSAAQGAGIGFPKPGKHDPPGRNDGT